MKTTGSIMIFLSTIAIGRESKDISQLLYLGGVCMLIALGAYLVTTSYYE